MATLHQPVVFPIIISCIKLGISDVRRYLRVSLLYNRKCNKNNVVRQISTFNGNMSNFFLFFFSV